MRKQKPPYVKLNLLIVVAWFIVAAIVTHLHVVELWLGALPASQANMLVNLIWLAPMTPSLVYLTYSVDVWRHIQKATLDRNKPSPKWLRIILTLILAPLVLFFVYGWYFWLSFTF